MFRALWIGLVAFIVAPALALAGPGTTHAIIVGVGTSADPQIQPRPHAEQDAKALYDLFLNTKHLGAPAENVKLFLTSEDEKRHAQLATKDKILAAFKDVAGKAQKDDMVLFVFVGRGATLADRTCFFASDSTFADRAKNALATADLETELKDLKSEKVVAFIDVNYKGVDPGKEKVLEPNALDMLRVFVGSEDKEEHTLPQGRVIFLANGSITPEVNTDNSGAYTKVIVDGLKGDADKEGYEPDGKVTVDELETYVEKTLPALARQIGKDKDAKLMFPVTWGGRNNHYAITRNPAADGPAQERLTKLPTLNFAPEVTTQGEKLLAKMPKLKADQELRKLFQQVVDGKLAKDAFLASRTANFDARKFSEEAAKTFASKTMEGINVIRSGYVRDLVMGEMVVNAVKGMYKRLDEKLPDEIKEQFDAVKEMRRIDCEKFLTQVRVQLGTREDLDGYKDVDLAITQVTLALDFPYTIYIDRDSKAKAEQDFRGRFTGIGIQIRRDLVRDGLLVVSPIKDSPGYKAGLKAGDLVTEIVTEMDENGRETNQQYTVSTKGLKTEDAVKRILGKRGTKVKVKIEREGVDQPIDFEIARGRVEVETVLGSKRLDDDSWEFMLDSKEKIGYIRLTQFTERSSDDMEAAVKKLTAAGVKGLVLDLRFNPGGLLDSAKEISDLFIDDGLIVSIRPRGKKALELNGRHEGSFANFPMVCLINGESASGSEIVSACLQDHRRAMIVGERSFGKGSVQTISNFKPTEGEIKMTTATFWRPNGKNLNKKNYEDPKHQFSDADDWGVRPDAGFEVKLDRKEKVDLFEQIRDQEIIPRRDIAAKEPKPVHKDKQLEAGLEYLRSQIKTASGVPGKKNG